MKTEHITVFIRKYNYQLQNWTETWSDTLFACCLLFFSLVSEILKNKVAGTNFQKFIFSFVQSMKYIVSKICLKSFEVAILGMPTILNIDYRIDLCNRVLLWARPQTYSIESAERLLAYLLLIFFAINSFRYLQS